jgi:hypothetical protein
MIDTHASPLAEKQCRARKIVHLSHFCFFGFDQIYCFWESVDTSAPIDQLDLQVRHYCPYRLLSPSQGAPQFSFFIPALYFF